MPSQPQPQLENRLRGGAAAWDDGPAGPILREDYFGIFLAAEGAATLGALTQVATATVTGDWDGSYTRPDGDAADFSFVGAPTYTRPDGDAADFGEAGEAPAGVVGTGAVTLPELEVAGNGTHGVAGTGAVTLPELDAAGVGKHGAAVVEGAGAVTLPELEVAGNGTHGVAGTGAASLGVITISATGAHGVAGSGSVALAGLAVAATGVHPRYELRGEVRLAGVLVDRRVRAYRRDTGALVSQADTVAGRFRLPAGLDQSEHYVVPIDMATGATDWLPPAANRLVPVLAMDEVAP